MIEYELTFRCFNGMRIELETDDDEKYIRREAAKYLLRARRRGHIVGVLTKNTSYEVITTANNDGVAVTDEDGTLHITEHHMDDDYDFDEA